MDPYTNTLFLLDGKGNRIRTAVHEAVHGASAKVLLDSWGKALSEGVTDTVTEQIRDPKDTVTRHSWILLQHHGCRH